MTPFLKRLSFHLIWMTLFTAAVLSASIAVPGIQETMLTSEAGNSGTAFRIPEFANHDNKQWDALHLGSSTCYRSLDPRVFSNEGLNTFNLCSSSQTFFNSYFILNWALEQGHTARCVTLDLQPTNWGEKGLESTRDFIINNDLVGDVGFQKMAWASQDPFSILLAFYFQWKRRYSTISKEQLVKETYQEGGFVESHLGALDTIECQPRQAILNRSNKRYLRRIQSICEANNIALIFINPPILCTPEWTMPSEFQAIPMIDGMKWELAESLEYHYDDVHLRGEGAQLYSEWLSPRLKALIPPSLANKSNEQ